MAMSYETLRSMSDEQLIERFDNVAKSTVTGLAWIRDELHRREMQRNGEALRRQSQTMTRLTWAITLLTLVNVAAILMSL